MSTRAQMYTYGLCRENEAHHLLFNTYNLMNAGLCLRIEMELVLVGKRIEFSPTCAEVTDMIVSVVHEMNKLLREVPTIQSWITGSSNQFVQVTLNKG